MAPISANERGSFTSTICAPSFDSTSSDASYAFSTSGSQTARSSAGMRASLSPATPALSVGSGSSGARRVVSGSCGSAPCSTL